jgi:hypothetical protein
LLCQFSFLELAKIREIRVKNFSLKMPFPAFPWEILKKLAAADLKFLPLPPAFVSANTEKWLAILYTVQLKLLEYRKQVK